MAQPPLAAVSDLAAWVGQDIPAADPRAGAVLSAASALVRGYTGQTWLKDDGSLDDVPDDVNAVTVQVAARVWLNPGGLESATLDDATRRWGAAGGLGLRLTDADKEALAGHVTGTPADLGTVSFTTGATPAATIYVPTGPPPSGDPFPWYAADDPNVLP